MIQDLNLQFDSAFAATTTAASTYYVDTLASGDAMPAGHTLLFKGIVTTAFTGLTTLSIALQTASETSFLLTGTTLIQSAAIAQATLVAGYVFGPFALPAGCLRYLRAYYTFVGIGTAGKITTELVLTSDKLLNSTLAALNK